MQARNSTLTAQRAHGWGAGREAGRQGKVADNARKNGETQINLNLTIISPYAKIQSIY